VADRSASCPRVGIRSRTLAGPSALTGSADGAITHPPVYGTHFGGMGGVDLKFGRHEIFVGMARPHGLTARPHSHCPCGMAALERQQCTSTSLGSACAGRRATVHATTTIAWTVMLAIPYDWGHAWRASSCASATLRAISLGRYPAVTSEAHRSHPMTRRRAHVVLAEPMAPLAGIGAEWFRRGSGAIGRVSACRALLGNGLNLR